MRKETSYFYSVKMSKDLEESGDEVVCYCY